MNFTQSPQQHAGERSYILHRGREHEHGAQFIETGPIKAKTKAHIYSSSQEHSPMGIWTRTN